MLPTMTETFAWPTDVWRRRKNQLAWTVFYRYRVALTTKRRCVRAKEFENNVRASITQGIRRRWRPAVRRLRLLLQTAGTARAREWGCWRSCACLDGIKSNNTMASNRRRIHPVSTQNSMPGQKRVQKKIKKTVRRNRFTGQQLT